MAMQYPPWPCSTAMACTFRLGCDMQLCKCIVLQLAKLTMHMHQTSNTSSHLNLCHGPVFSIVEEQVDIASHACRKCSILRKAAVAHSMVLHQ